MEKHELYFNNDGKIDCYEIYCDNIENIDKILEIPIEKKVNYSYKIGPYKNFNTSFSSNVINILKRVNFFADRFELVKLYDVNNFEYDPMTECVYSDDQELIKSEYPETINLGDVDLLAKYGLSFDIDELGIYLNMYSKLDRTPTFIEAYDLCQSNSEHSRHWFFKGKLIFKDYVFPYKSLFDMVKSTLNKNSNSLVAFSDNSSAIKGFNANKLVTRQNKVLKSNSVLDFVLTAETHNFPTLICPFQGAGTGIGGRIRDNQSIGKGAYILAGSAGYCVGDIFNHNMKEYKAPISILIEASNGASDYGNKIGEPIIGGFTRSFSNYNNDSYEFIKPIMFTAGYGMINRKDLYKDQPKKNQLIVRIGGPAYKIGLGGGFCSSVDQDKDRKNFDISAVQRGDPQMANKLTRVVKTLIDLEENPIVSIHDQGAGGLANVVKEIVYPLGAEINLNMVTLGDKSLHPLEIWCSEFQESDVLLVNEENLDLIKNCCKKENICCDVLGKINDSEKIKVYYDNKIILDFPLKDVLEPNLQKYYQISEKQNNFMNKTFYENISIDINSNIKNVLSNLDVGSKRFLTNKVDRSVTGLIAQQQCVGPFQTPISNYSLICSSYFETHGCASAIGEKPILGLLSSKSQGSMSVGEMVTNMMGVYIEKLENIKCSANWMWPLKMEGESYKLVKTAIAMCDTLKSLEIGIDGGKDSLSMTVNHDGNIIKSPGSIVITGYSSCPNIYKKVTPDFKNIDSSIYYIKLNNHYRIGGSVFTRENNCLYDFEPPELSIDDCSKLKKLFVKIQECIYDNEILALHDISDGGLVSTLCEMSMSSGLGCDIKIEDDFNLINYLFNEEIGILVEVSDCSNKFKGVIEELVNNGLTCVKLGKTTKEKSINILHTDKTINLDLRDVIKSWEKTSLFIEKKQCLEECVNEEIENLLEIDTQLFFENNIENVLDIDLHFKPKICVLREEGSNGDKEMCAAFFKAGFDVFDISMNTLLKEPDMLNNFRGIAYVGGFSHGDVLGAAHGWYITFKNNENLRNALKNFNHREDTFSLGVCNGCQLLVKQKTIDNETKIIRNKSGRFESRFLNVKIMDDNNIFFKGLKNTNFGIWIAHGEGRFINTDSLRNNQKVLRYVKNNEPTSSYPYNPNGSNEGLAGICSNNGRHLAMMPHPERCFLDWQVPIKHDIKHSNPWSKMFKNIYEWCYHSKD